MSTVAGRVARGAALLNEKLPGWDERIDLAGLELSSCYRCVLGQLFARSPGPETGSELSPYGLGIWALDLRGSGADYGFDGPDTDALNAEWRKVIEAARAAPRVPAGATA